METDLGESAGGVGSLDPDRLRDDLDRYRQHGAGTPTATASTAPASRSVPAETGTLTIEDGAVLSNPFSYIKIGQYGTPVPATVTGTNSTLSAGGTLRVGDSGTRDPDGRGRRSGRRSERFRSAIGRARTAPINVDAGGTVSTNSASNIDVGQHKGPPTAARSMLRPARSISAYKRARREPVDVDGGTLQAKAVLTVGDGGHRQIPTVSDNGTVTSQDGDIGTGAGNNGTVTCGWPGLVLVNVGQPADRCCGAELEPPR